MTVKIMFVVAVIVASLTFIIGLALGFAADEEW